MQAYGGVDVCVHVFFTSALVGGDWSASRPGRFTPGTHWIGGWMGPRAGLDDLEDKKFLALPVRELKPSHSTSSVNSLNEKLFYPPKS
jgi:hypothetical protein